MNVRVKQNNYIKGTSSKFNESSLNEVIVNFDDGDSDSMYMSDLEVLITRELKWVSMPYAFIQKLIITDKYNTHFFEPKDEEEKKRGYRI